MSKKLVSLCLAVIMMCAVITTSYAGELKWTEDSVYRSYDYLDAACNNSGLYVVVGEDGIIRTSGDLSNWSDQDSGTKQDLRGCTYGNGKFIAVGPNGTVVYSQDGIKWLNADVDQTIDFEDVTWGDGKFYAIGKKNPLAGKDNHQRYILASEDGTNWAIIFENEGLSYWTQINYINNTFVVIGLWRNIVYSADGLNWTVKNFEEMFLNDIIWDGKQYVGVGANSDIYTSSDLSAWVRFDTNLLGKNYLRKIVKFGEQYIIALFDGETNVLLASFNLSDWYIASWAGYKDIIGFIEKDNTLAAYGFKETILQTTDGVNWKIDTRNSSNLLKVIWNGENYLVIGTDGVIMLSPDGLNWESYRTTIDKVLIDAIWTGEKFTALGIAYGEDEKWYEIAEAEIYQSTDGIHWVSMGVLGTTNAERIFCFNNKYFVLGRDGEITSSNDLVKWTSIPSGTKQWLKGMAWNGKRYVCVGSTGTILSSVDGESWGEHFVYPGNNLRNVIWDGTEFIAVGECEIVRSKDGITWNSVEEVSLTNYNKILWDGKRYIALSNIEELYELYDGMIFNSFPDIVEIRTSNGEIVALVVSEGIRTCMSSDGIRWELSALTYEGMASDIAWNGYRYVIVGNDETIFTAVPDDIIKVIVDGKPVLFDVAPINKEGRNLVPLRAIFNALGAEVEWDGSTRTITGTKGETKIVLQLDSNQATINGAAKMLDVPATSYNGRTMVPARFIAESLGADVYWDGSTQTVVITTKN